jgi:alanyl-tRNA synthetase
LEKEVASLQLALAKSKAGDLKDQARNINGINVLAAEFEGHPKTLRSEADRLRDSFGSAVIVLGSRKKGVQLIVAVTKDLTPRIHAGKLIKEISAVIDGKGGGRPDMAQAGGKSPDKLPQALEKAYAILEESL